MTQIDTPPIATALEVMDAQNPKKVIGKLSLLNSVFATWFNQIALALQRPTVSVPVTFPLTNSGQYASLSVTFPRGSVRPGVDGIVLASPVPPQGTCFSAHCSVDDLVVILFHNYSGSALAFALPQVFTVTILQN